MTVEKVLYDYLELTKKQVSRAKFRPDGICKNKIQCRVTEKVSMEDEICICLETDEIQSAQLVLAKIQGERLRILYEDEDILAVNKPTGVLTHPAGMHYSDSLANQVAAQRLQEQRETGVLEKQYLALVDGNLPKDQDDIWHTIDFPIKKIGNHPLRMEAVKKSSSAENEKYIAHQLTDYINCFQAVTHYHVLYSTDKWSAIKLKLDTGRTHQIRVHMQAIGHPLLGDSIYNTSTMNREQCTIYRAALHAWKVRLRQPFNGRKIELEVPVPEDFKKYGGFYVSSSS